MRKFRECGPEFDPELEERWTGACRARARTVTTSAVALGLLAASIGSIAPVQSARAQEATSDQTAPDLALTGQVCLAKTFESDSGEILPIMIQVSSEKANALTDRGYAIGRCEMFVRAQARDQQDICGVAATADASVNALYQHVFSMTAMELCRNVSFIGSLSAGE